MKRISPHLEIHIKLFRDSPRLSNASQKHISWRILKHLKDKNLNCKINANMNRTRLKVNLYLDHELKKINKTIKAKYKGY